MHSWSLWPLTAMMRACPVRAQDSVGAPKQTCQPGQGLTLASGHLADALPLAARLGAGGVLQHPQRSEDLIEGLQLKQPKHTSCCRLLRCCAPLDPGLAGLVDLPVAAAALAGAGAAAEGGGAGLGAAAAAAAG